MHYFPEPFSGHYILPAMPKGSKRTSLGPTNTNTNVHVLLASFDIICWADKYTLWKAV